MPSYVTAKINTQHISYISLVDQADTKLFKANPTIAAGDFKVSTDGGALANLATLPVVTPAGGKLVKITLSAAEMNGDNIVLVASDAAGAEWTDLTVPIQTTAQQIDDLNSVVPDAAGVAPTAVEIRTEMDSNSVDFGSILANQATLSSEIGAIPTNPALATVCTELRLSELDAANLPSAVDSRMAEASINTTAGAVDIVSSANMTSIDGDTTSAVNLSKSTIAIVPGAAVAGTLSTTQMTTDLTEVTDDHFIGRIVIWTSGVLKNQATDIVDYFGATKTVVYTATTESPAISDTFVIL